jgi:hypothetical protein
MQRNKDWNNRDDHTDIQQLVRGIDAAFEIETDCPERQRLEYSVHCLELPQLGHNESEAGVEMLEMELVHHWILARFHFPFVVDLSQLPVGSVVPVDHTRIDSN